VETPTEVPTDTPEPLPTDTPEPLPTDTLEPHPTDTLVPIPTDTPIVMPTVPLPDDTSVPLPPGILTPTPVPPNGNGTVLEDSAFMGGYTREDGYHGRSAQWVYGQGTEYNTMTAQFTIERKPKGRASLTLVGLDSEDKAKTPMRVTLNDQVVFDGPDPLPNDTENGPQGEGNWGSITWRLENKALQEGQNTISITNLDPSDQINFPIFIMIDQVALEW
jgi:serine/threonine-protein kinase